MHTPSAKTVKARLWHSLHLLFYWLMNCQSMLLFMYDIISLHTQSTQTDKMSQCLCFPYIYLFYLLRICQSILVFLHNIMILDTSSAPIDKARSLLPLHLFILLVQDVLLYVTVFVQYDKFTHTIHSN